MTSPDFPDFNDLSLEHQEMFKGLIATFFNHKLKQQHVIEFSDIDKIALVTTITAISSVSERILEKARGDEEWRKIRNWLHISKQQSEILPQLIEEFAARKQVAIKKLLDRKGQLEDEILGSHREDYRNIQGSNRPDKERICTRLWESCTSHRSNRENLEKYKQISFDIFTLISDISFTITSDTIKVESSETDMLDYFAFLVFNPLYIVFFEHYLIPGWNSFPLKWCKYRMSVSEIRTFFDMFTDGEDVHALYINDLESRGFGEIEKALTDPAIRFFLLQDMTGADEVIREGLTCYKEKKYASSIYTILPVLEGLIWKYSDFIDRMQIAKIYTTGTDKKQLYDTVSNNLISDLTVGRLMTRSEFRDFVDQDFIRYFCGELYRERNPILHGSVFSFANKKAALEKIATLEYILLIIKEDITQKFITKLDQRLPTEYVERILARYKR